MIRENLFPHNDTAHIFDSFIKPSSITNGGNNKNFSFFVNQIAKTDLKKVYEGIAKLMIIDVSLDHEKDNPQLQLQNQTL